MSLKEVVVQLADGGAAEFRHRMTEAGRLVSSSIGAELAESSALSTGEIKKLVFACWHVLPPRLGVYGDLPLDDVFDQVNIVLPPAVTTMTVRPLSVALGDLVKERGARLFRARNWDVHQWVRLLERCEANGYASTWTYPKQARNRWTREVARLHATTVIGGLACFVTVTAPDGSESVYTYNDAGNWYEARYLAKSMKWTTPSQLHVEPRTRGGVLMAPRVYIDTTRGEVQLQQR